MRVTREAKDRACYYQKRKWHFLKENDPVAYRKLLDENRLRHKAWTEKKLSEDPLYFKRKKIEYTKRTFEQRREKNLIRNYGLSIAQYEALVIFQGGRCAICGTDKPKERHKSGNLHVDHDHKTGKRRGLLCGSCNSALGLFKDDPEIISKAAQYLRSFSEVLIVV